MTQQQTVDRITSDICTLIECDLGSYCDCYFLAAPVSAAVRKCLRNCGALNKTTPEAEKGLAKIILFAVEKVLSSYRIGDDWIVHLSGEVERAVTEALRAVPQPLPLSRA